jgi:hypothetical protein
MSSEREAHDFIDTRDSAPSDAAARQLLASQMTAATFAHRELEHARVWLESTLTRTPDGHGPPTFDRTRDLCAVLVLLGKDEEARTRAHDLLVLARTIGDPLRTWDAHFTLSLFDQRAGDLASAARHGQAALKDGRATSAEAVHDQGVACVHLRRLRLDDPTSPR